MKPDTIVTITYWCLSLLTFICMMFVTIRYCIKNGTKSEKYTILTFVFMNITLLMRGLAIIPILIDEHKTEDKNWKWEQMVFNGAPTMLFVIGWIFNTLRWYDIQMKLLTGTQTSIWLRVTIISIAIYSIILVICGTVLFWSFSDLGKFERVLLIIAVISFVTQHLMVIILNIISMIVFHYKLSRKFKILYDRIKWKLFSFLTCSWILVFLRLIAFSIFYYFSTQYYVLKILPEEIVALVITEIVPCVFLILTFIFLTGRENRSRIDSSDTSVMSRTMSFPYHKKGQEIDIDQVVKHKTEKLPLLKQKNSEYK